MHCEMFAAPRDREPKDEPRAPKEPKEPRVPKEPTVGGWARWHDDMMDHPDTGPSPDPTPSDDK